jgi:hypothetical protein
MARRQIFDVLQDHYFWAFDATHEGVPVFNPLFGFSGISSPEINVNVESFKDGTFLYNRSVVKGGEVGPVTFTRAATMFDSDFYEWIIFALHGDKEFLGDGGTLGKITAGISNFLSGGARITPRRNLLIVHFTRINLKEALSSDDPLIRTAAVAGALVVGSLATGSLSGAGVIAGAAAAQGFGIGPFQFATRIPARAWLLHNCIPVRYRPGNDFDAASGQVSIQELEVQPEYVEEYSLGLKP